MRSGVTWLTSPRRASSSMPTAEQIRPDVQYPHCKPSCLMNAACIAWSWSPVASPSIVLTARPSTLAASVRQASTRRPSTRTVAGAALSLVAALLRAGQLQPLADCVQQNHARVDFQRPWDTIDLQCDLDQVLGCCLRGEDRVGRRRPSGQGVLVREQVEGEGAQAAGERVAEELPARLTDVGQRRHLFEQRPFVRRQSRCRRIVHFFIHRCSADPW